MSPAVFAVLPSRGEYARGAWSVPPRPGLPALDYLAQAGRAAEIATFAGVVVPYDPAGEESWTVTGDLLRHSRWSQVVVQFPPTFATPVYAAKVSATLQRFTAGRLAWWPAPDADESSLGLLASDEDRYARADEFLTVARGVWSRQPFDHNGSHYQVVGGGFGTPLAGRPFPRVYLSGRDPRVLRLSARHADVHVFSVAGTAGDLVDDVAGGHLAETIAELRELAGGAGRVVEVGLRVGAVAREDGNDLELAARTSDGAAITGSYEEVAKALRRLAELGVSTVFADLSPAVEEAYRWGEQVLPQLREEQANVG